MSVTAAIRVQTDLDRFATQDSETPVQSGFLSFDTPTQSPRTSHYRPYSTLISDSLISEQSNQKSLKRSSSFGGLQMGLHFNSRRLQVVSPPPPLSPPPTTPHISKKKSMVSLLASPESSASSNLSPTISAVQPPTPAPTEIVERQTSLKPVPEYQLGAFGQNSTARRFVPKNIWSKRHNMKLHPYQKDVPYMQAYDPILLESDRYTDILLQRLTAGSPSFHDYGKKPPSTILDLGCGPGHWILHAANQWKNSSFTGFDLVDVTLPGFDTAENVQFVQGDFLNFRLPFPNKYFEYIRMANLVLCIPHEKWHEVLKEVHRMLAPGGRLELIDDQIYFPYGNLPQESPPSPSSSVFDSDDENLMKEDDDETLLGEETESTLNGSSESGESRSSSFDEPTPMGVCESATVRPFSQYLPLTPAAGEREFQMAIAKGHAVSPDSSPISPRFAGLASRRESKSTVWQNQAAASRNLEKVFNRMVSEEYGIHTKDGDFVVGLLQDFFGKDRAGKTKSFHIKLAPVDSPIAESGKEKGNSFNQEENRDRSSSDASTNGANGRIIKDEVNPAPSPALKKRKPWSRKIKKEKVTQGQELIKVSSQDDIPLLAISKASPTDPSLRGLSAKAAGRLGISYSALAAATVKSTPGRRSTSSPQTPVSGVVQHPGLLVWPSTYIPIGPAELEMHACKYVHTLLGCRPALSAFVAKHVDENGDRWVNEDEFGEEIWQYECFRRSRLNWPSEVADPEDDPLNKNAYTSSDSPTRSEYGSFPSTSNGSTASLDVPMVIQRSTSASASISSTAVLPMKSTQDMFSRTLRNTKSNLLIRAPKRSATTPSPNSTAKTFPHSRATSPVRSSHSSTPQSRGNSLDADVDFNGQYHKDELLHLRTIRVFEAVKASVHDRPGTPDSIF